MSADSSIQEGAHVDLMSVPLETLISIKRKAQQELRMFSESHEKLSELLSDFDASVQCVKSLKKLQPNNEVIVPCNQMMCVRGKLVDTELVTVDIGTGYYAELTIDEAVAQFKRKIELVEKKITEIQEVLKSHSDLLPVIDEVLKKRISEHTAANKSSDMPSSMSNLALSK